jgi:hypothetical protein
MIYVHLQSAYMDSYISLNVRVPTFQFFNFRIRDCLFVVSTISRLQYIPNDSENVQTLPTCAILPRNESTVPLTCHLRPCRAYEARNRGDDPLTFETNLFENIAPAFAKVETATKS